MWSQLPRIRSTVQVFIPCLHAWRTIMNPTSLGPMKVVMKSAKHELEIIHKTNNEEEKHWLCGGDRSIALAATLLQQGKAIAVPTDTVYGLASLASNQQAVQNLYKIKGRNENKPLAICLSNVADISCWAVVDKLPSGLLQSILPGPYTVILHRTPALNPALNPNIDNVGIRVPDAKFVRSVAEIVGPLALTSANVSNEPSSLHPSEFSTLWPVLDGIFYHIPGTCGKRKVDKDRIGSTVVDLSQPMHYKIVRHGTGADFLIKKLKAFGLVDATDGTKTHIQ